MSYTMSLLLLRVHSGYGWTILIYELNVSTIDMCSYLFRDAVYANLFLTSRHLGIEHVWLPSNSSD